MAPLSALDVARWFLMRNNVNVKQYDEEMLTHLKIQKLLYYAQGVFLAYTGSKLFDEDIYAWDHGPVVRQVYDAYKVFGPDPIKCEPTGDDSTIFEKVAQDPRIGEVLETVHNFYGKYSAWRLREMTHDEKPWRQTPRNEIISEELIKDYFSKEVLE